MNTSSNDTETSILVNEVDAFNRTSKLSNLKIQMCVYIINKIVLKELHKSYYKNAMNVKEKITLKNISIFDHFRGIKFTHIENVWVYQNGFYRFGSFNCHIYSIPDHEPSQLIYFKQASSYR